ncbi:MAG: phosphodiester glycosidase family protein, partial [Burkholderiales bacterium]
LWIAALWEPIRPGVWQQRAQMAKKGPLAAVSAIAIRVDPAAHSFQLHLARHDYGLRPAWTIDSIPERGVVAVNAGQFTAGFPWGWLVRNGVESQPPGTGTLGMSFVVDARGRVALVMPDEIESIRSAARYAFQSYPALLVDGKLPWELRGPGRGVDLAHRDSRLAVCTLRTGELVIVLTRFTALGDAGATLPWGPTVPEMAAYMRSLGCRRAMLLDGGISSQVAVRAGDGSVTRWTNWRTVPLGLVILPKQ